MLNTVDKKLYFTSTPTTISFPVIPNDVDDFAFTANTFLGVFSFEAHWRNSLWKLYVTLPSGKVRQATVWPQIITWSLFTDYSMSFYTPYTDNVKHDDISKTTMWIAKR